MKSLRNLEKLWINAYGSRDIQPKSGDRRTAIASV